MSSLAKLRWPGSILVVALLSFGFGALAPERPAGAQVTLRAQPVARAISIVAAGCELVVTLPAGSPPLALDLGDGMTVTVPGEPTVTIPKGHELTISFPSGGQVTLPGCDNKRIRVSGAGAQLTTPVRGATKAN